MVPPQRPPASTPAVAARMARQRRRDTQIELDLRRCLHRLGFRYRVNLPIPGLPRRRADISFISAKVHVFVDGCFWHGCPEHGTKPKSNSDWWAAKLAANLQRDRETDAHVQASGWQVVRIWEHVSTAEATDMVVSSLHRAAGRG